MRHSTILLLSCIFVLHIGANSQNTNTLILQPDQSCAKETMIWQLDDQNGPFGTTNSNNYDGIGYLPIMNWTWNGSPGQRFVLMDFFHDLDLPVELDIVSASLSLFAPENSTSDGFHALESNTGKASIAVIQNITSNWDASAVSWNTQPATTEQNEIVLEAPNSEMQHYPDIDVTELVRAQISEPDSHFGFLLRMQAQDYYRKLIFAGSAAENPDLRPRLELKYRGAAIHTEPLPIDLIYSEYLTICPGDSQTLYTTNPDAISSFLWSTGETTPSIVVQDTGHYTLIATINECLSAVDTVMVSYGSHCFPSEPCEVFVPDIFSPNQDGINDEFRPFYANECVLPGSFRLEVFNRWGQQVFVSEDPTIGWRGDYRSKPASADVYIWQLQYLHVGAPALIKRSGQLTLVR